MPFAELGEKRIWYEITGDGEPLVQLPGAGLGLRNFSRVTPFWLATFGWWTSTWWALVKVPQRRRDIHYRTGPTTCGI